MVLLLPKKDRAAYALFLIQMVQKNFGGNFLALENLYYFTIFDEFFKFNQP